MSKAREIYRVRGIDGTCYPDKLTAETAARAEFPDESADLRYSRIYFLRMEDNVQPGQPKQTIAYTVTGFDENRAEDTHEYCFATADDAREFVQRADAMPYSGHMTWRRNTIVINDDVEQSLHSLLRDLTNERDVNGYGADDEEGEEA